MKLSHYEWDPEKDLIAEGASAEVFKAKDTNSQNRYVALKIYKEAVIKGVTGSSSQKKYTLEKEFDKIDGLSHTNIISFYGLDYLRHIDVLGRSSSNPIIIMEYASEGTLHDIIKTNPSPKVINSIIEDILRGVGYLHSEGIIHRDLKPGNILISKNRKGKFIAKITDFGISRDILSNEKIEQSFTEGVGTPHYMAPEQFFKKKFGLKGEISERTDIWAIGVVIYRLLTGKLPFGHGSKDYELIRDAIVTDEPDYGIIASGYKTGLMSCFQKEAVKRPKTVQELLELFKSEEEVDFEEIKIDQSKKLVNLNKDGEIVEKPIEKETIIEFNNVVDEEETIFPSNVNSDSQIKILKKQVEPKINRYNKKHKILLIILLVFLTGTVLYANRYNIVMLKYDEIGPFGYDSNFTSTARARLDTKWGLIDKKGKVIVPLKYEDIDDSFKKNHIPAKWNGKWGLVNKKDEIMIPFKYEDFHWEFYEGFFAAKLNGKWGLVREKDKIVVPFKYDDISPSPSEGLVAAKLNGKWGFIGDNENMNIPFKYENTHKRFYEGLVAAELNGKWGFIDKNGKVVIPFQYSDVKPFSFSEGLVAVKLNYKWGYIDKNGKTIIPFKYDYAIKFSNGTASVGLNGKSIKIDKKGNESFK